MSAAIERAIGELRSQLDDLQQRRAGIDSEIILIQNAIKALVTLTEGTSGASPKRTQGVKGAVEAIMRDSKGQRIHADQVLNEVRSRGIQVSAADPKATVVTALIRLARERSAEGVWKLPRNYWVWSATEPPDHVGREQSPATPLPESRTLLRPA